MMKQRIETVTLQKIVNDGQTLGTLEDGQKVFVWGALPGEAAEVSILKKKSRLAQAVAEKILKPAPERVEPRDPESYLSTSPWQIMSFEAENKWKQQLVRDAFKLHYISLPKSKIITDGEEYHYRNKVEFSWWWDKEAEKLDLAFFRRGSKGKIPVDGTSLAREEINQAARRVRDFLQARNVGAYRLKTLLIRCDQEGNVAAQLYVKEDNFIPIQESNLESLNLRGLEIIYSNPKSPASVRTKTLATYGETTLTDELLGVPFTYATGGFFQVNLPVYEKALEEIKKWTPAELPVVDLYSGVGTIGLTATDHNLVLVEQDETCVQEMTNNVEFLGRQAEIVQASSETALDYITHDHAVIVDPPRAGLHQAVIDAIEEAVPPRIVYLSCNPTTQARDVERLLNRYEIAHSVSFNFFPRTPHIEHLIVLAQK